MCPDLLEQNKLIFKDEAYKTVGAAMEVHRELGPGFLEAVYHEALLIEFEKRSIPYQSDVALPIFYKKRPLKKKYISDIICFNKIIVELKATNSLDTLHESQVLNYLKATGFRLGVLINFGEISLKYKRLVL